MYISVRAILATQFLLALTFAAALPLSGKSDEAKLTNDDERKGKDEIVTVLYEGPLSHDQN